MVNNRFLIFSIITSLVSLINILVTISNPNLSILISLVGIVAFITAILGKRKLSKVLILIWILSQLIIITKEKSYQILQILDLSQFINLKYETGFTQSDGTLYLGINFIAIIYLIVYGVLDKTPKSSDL